MKITIKHKDSDIPKENYDFYNDFIKYLQKEYPLIKDITIIFFGKKTGGMTTGSRTENNQLHILSKGRMNRDILRTLAHEWYHEYDRTVLKNPKGANIGSKSEDDANSEAGAVIKKYERDNPKNIKKMYK
jgi:predicted metalloprotease with PDZ domain